MEQQLVGRLPARVATCRLCGADLAAHLAAARKAVDTTPLGAVMAYERVCRPCATTVVGAETPAFPELPIAPQGALLLDLAERASGLALDAARRGRTA